MTEWKMTKTQFNKKERKKERKKEIKKVQLYGEPNGWWFKKIYNNNNNNINYIPPIWFSIELHFLPFILFIIIYLFPNAFAFTFF